MEGRKNSVSSTSTLKLLEVLRKELENINVPAFIGYQEQRIGMLDDFIGMIEAFKEKINAVVVDERKWIKEQRQIYDSAKPCGAAPVSSLPIDKDETDFLKRIQNLKKIVNELEAATDEIKQEMTEEVKSIQHLENALASNNEYGLSLNRPGRS